MIKNVEMVFFIGQMEANASVNGKKVLLSEYHLLGKIDGTIVYITENGE
jgi:hypothetical protein